MRQTPSSTFQVRARIHELAPGGDGVAHVGVNGERRAVFVRGAALEEEVDLDVDFTSRPARGRMLRVAAPGPTRVVPACPHVQRCGGCAWMHLSVEGQKQAHRTQLMAALPEEWRSIAIVSHDAPDAFEYRTRTRLHARGSGGRTVVGLHETGTHDPVEVDHCVVLHPNLDRARLALGPLLEEAQGYGDARIALGKAERPVLELAWKGTLARASFARIDDAVRNGQWAGARVFEGEVSRAAVFGDPTPWTLGADAEPLRLAPGGFAQTSAKANVILGERLLALTRAATGGSLGSVLELYAGSGNFTVLLARHSDRVLAVESSVEACDAARQNLAARGLTAKVVLGLAEEHPIRPGTDLVVLDPPRTGARKVGERLAASKARAILYLSCDVATLARDLATLATTFQLVSLESFLLFPHTPHAETLALLVRKGRPRRVSTP
jgi:23S rRNA (uracil1939-C5)-methyltransferase